jgi:hypothetical protein
MITLTTHPNRTAGFCLYLDGAPRACLAAGARRTGGESGSVEAAAAIQVRADQLDKVLPQPVHHPMTPAQL